MRFGALILWLAGCGFSHGQAPSDATPGDGLADGVPDAALPVVASCLQARLRGITTDGPQTIDPDGPGGAEPFAAYCDMTTLDGGWTLVYAYTFTQYGTFMANGNAITPRPSWPFTSGEQSVPVSTTIPTSPASRGALDFARWRELGSEILVTSTINHWIACTPGTGSLVLGTSGSVACALVKLVATKCTAIVPITVSWIPRGPLLAATSLYYYWEGSQAMNWPAHDPCGTNMPNQLTNVADPRGAIFVR